jgi:hypothetical protein
MAGNGLRKEVRRRLYAFGGQVASCVRDSHRQRFLQEMIVGLVIAVTCILPKLPGLSAQEPQTSTPWRSGSVAVSTANTGPCSRSSTGC